MKEMQDAERELRKMLTTLHAMAQHYAAFSATEVRQIEDEILVEQQRIEDIRGRSEHDEDIAEEYADALERIADLNGALQRAKEGHERAKRFGAAEQEP